MLRARSRVPFVVVLASAMALAVTPGVHSAPGDTQIFADNFEGGDLSNWTTNVSGSGVAVVENGIGHDGPNAARLLVPNAGAKANIQKYLSPQRYALSAAGWFKVLKGGCNSAAAYSNGNVPFFRFFDEDGRRIVGLYRINGPSCGDNTKVYVQHTGGFFRVGVNVKFGIWYKIELRAAVQDAGASLVEVYVNGGKKYTTTTANNGLKPFNSVVIHNEHPDQVGELVADDIVLSTFGSGPAPTNPCNTATATPTTSDPGAVVVADNFEGYNFANWSEVEQAGDGTATIQTAIRKTGNCAVKLHVSSASTSKANLRKNLPAGTTDVWADGWFYVQTEGSSNSNVPFFRIFNGTTNRIIDVYRQNVTGTLFVRLPGASGFTYTSLGMSLPLGEWHRIKVHGTATAGADLVQVWVDGVQKLNKSDAEFGVSELNLVRIGSEHNAQVMDLYADDVIVTAS